MTSRVLTYEQAFLAGTECAGGKAWNLARLARYGFPVPRGGVLTAEVYLELIARPVLQDRVEALRAVAAEQVVEATVTTILAELAATIRAQTLDRETMTRLSEFLDRHQLLDRPLAVRSSAVAEDGQSASFAGIHESRLNVWGLPAVCQAVLDCYASLWSPQALAYRRKMKIADHESACAVLICEMVQGPGGGVPQAAGVAFTCEPLSGRRDVIAVNLAAGLGDAVVRGEVTPDRYLLDPMNQHRVIEREQHGAALLSDQQLAQLGQLCWRTHWALGAGQDPLDIEWAFDGRAFWLLQSRPVTRLPRHTFPEIAQQPLYWSNGNLKDSFPEPVTTMTAAMTELVVRDVLFASQMAINYAMPPGLPVMRRFEGRFYFDLAVLQWSLYDAFGILPEEVNRTTGGFQPEIEVPPGNPLAGRAGRSRAWRRLKLLHSLARFRRQLPKEVAGVFDDNRRARESNLSELSDTELEREFERRVSRGNAFVPQLQLAASYYGAWMTVLQDFLARVTGDRRQGLVTRLLAGTGGVASAEQGYRLVELSELARREPEAPAAVVSDDPRAWTSLPERSSFRREFERYLAEFGHRGVLEMEFSSPRWRDDPTYLLQQVAALLETESGPDPRRRAEQVRRGAEQELAQLRWYARPIARWLLAKTRAGAVVREKAKSAAAASVDTMQMALLEIGRRLCARGQLDAAKDVFHLAIVDVRALLDGTWNGGGARELVADRKQTLARQRAAVPPDLIVEEGTGASPAHHAPPSTHGAMDGTTWQGFAAAPGVAEGPARVLATAAAGSTLRAGEVLVAPSTDPGWTPLFLRASAVVMETGGYLSHGAVVAREYGIPSVVNVPNAMKLIATGDLLFVDGERGEVRRLSAIPETQEVSTTATAQT